MFDYIAAERSNPRSNQPCSADDIANFGIRFTGSSFQGHVYVAFRQMPTLLKTIGELFNDAPFEGNAGLSFSKSSSHFAKKTSFVHHSSKMAMEKEEIGNRGLGVKRFLDVDDLRFMGIMLYFAGHYEALRTGKVDRLLYLLLEFLPKSASSWRKVLKTSDVLKGSDSKEDYKKRLEFYSTLLEDVGIFIFHFFHENVDVLFDTKHGIPQMKYSSKELMEQDMDFNKCFNGNFKHKYGNYNNEKYVYVFCEKTDVMEHCIVNWFKE